ncbi:MAG: hypothetical protein IT492_09180 [Gammaproteobacteria bacterium]|nr:hypothetical protein [Gammaproteobacteria bacterium]
MNGTRLFTVLALALFSLSFMSPASARTSDAPAFGVWLAQWAQYGRRNATERLPCLGSGKANCNSVFSSSAAARKSVAHKRSTRKAVKAKRHKVAMKHVKRVKASTRVAPKDLAGFTWAGGALVLANAAHGKLLTIAPDAEHDNAGVETQALSAFLDDADRPAQDELAVVPDVAAGVGNNAYAALYDFEDNGGAGENQRGFQEISSLASEPAVLLAAVNVPEPASVLLVGGAMLVLRLTTRRRDQRGRMLPGAI